MSFAPLVMDALKPVVAALAPANVFYESLFAATRPYVLSVPILESFAETLDAAVGIGSNSVARLLVSVVLAYPAGVLLPWLPAEALRHAWTAAVGALLVQFVFGVGFLHLLLPSAVVYLVLALSAGTGLLRGRAHWVCVVLSFGYLMFRHAARSGVTSSNIDDSTLVMVLAIKLYTLVYNLHDGTYDSKRIAGDLAAAEAKKDESASRVLKDRAKRSISSLPSPLAFLGYVYSFPTVFVGPAFEITEYLESQAGTRGGSGKGAHASYVGSRFAPAVWKFVQGVVWLGASAVLGATFPTARLYDLAVATAPVTPWASLMGFTCAALIVSRFQYYAIWKLAEGSAVLGGFGYRPEGSGGKANPAVGDFEYITGWGVRETVRAWLTPRVDVFGMGIKGLPDWEGACNVNPITVETRISIAETITNWNMHTQSWLAKYIFVRLPKSVNKHVTFLASAFWHGFYPGYYLTFATFFLMQESGKAFLGALDARFGYSREAKNGTFFAPTTGFGSFRIVRVVAWLVQFAVQTLAMCYAGQAFMLFEWHRSIAVWSHLQWAGHIAAVCFYVISIIIAPAVKKGSKVAAAVTTAAPTPKGKGVKGQ